VGRIHNVTTGVLPNQRAARRHNSEFQHNVMQDRAGYAEGEIVRSPAIKKKYTTRMDDWSQPLAMLRSA